MTETGVRSRGRARARTAFSARDLLAALALVACCVALIAPDGRERAARRRDARRVHDVELLRDAIERFQRDTGRYPRSSPGESPQGWDVSWDGAFVPELVRAGYLSAEVHDPLDDERFHYRYRVYPPGSCGCGDPDGFYVVGASRYESPRTRERRPGSAGCSGPGPAHGLAFVCGGGHAIE